MMPNPSQPLIRVASLAAPGLFVVLWSTGFIGAKLGLPYAEPLTFLGLRMAGVVVLLAVIVAIARPVWPSLPDVMHSVVTGLLVHGLYLGGVFISIHLGLPAGLSAMVVGLQPLLTAALAAWLFHEAVGRRQWFGLALGLIGVALVVEGRSGEGAAPLVAWVAAVVGLLGISAGTLYQKAHGSRIDWRYGLLVQYAAAGVAYAVAATVFETRAVTWSGEFVFALGWLVVVLSFGAVWLLYALIRRSAAARVASLFYLTPAVTALMAWVLFNERLDAPAVAGMGLCLLAVALVNLRPRPSPAAPTIDR